jgi:hypothetical protein
MSTKTAELKTQFIPLPAQALLEPEGAGGYRLRRVVASSASSRM